MPAVSQAQQSLFGLAKAVKKGKVAPSKVGPEVKKIAKSMSNKEIDKFAKTKKKELPKKKVEPKKEAIETLRSTIREMVKTIINKDVVKEAKPSVAGSKNAYTSRRYISNLEQAWSQPLDAYDDIKEFLSDVNNNGGPEDLYGGTKMEYINYILKAIRESK